MSLSSGLDSLFFVDFADNWVQIKFYHNRDNSRDAQNTFFESTILKQMGYVPYILVASTSTDMSVLYNKI